jgi:hypothetical protein
MKKSSTRLRTQVKTGVKLKNRLKQAAYVGAFAFGIFSAALVYHLVGDSEESKANNRFNGVETLAEFKYRKQITLSSELLPDNQMLHQFPVMITISDADLKSVANGGKVTSDKGDDFRFTKADGVSLLNYEIEHYDPITGSLRAWVQVDSLSKASEKLFVYFNNGFATSESGQNAWNKTYKGVWHLRGSLSHKTPWANQMASIAPASETKDVYVAAERNASQFPCLNTSEDVDITGALTVSAWVRIDEKGEQTIVGNQSGFNGGYRLSVNKQRKIEFSISNENAVASIISGEETGSVLEKGVWYHVAGTYSDKADTMITYINGRADRGMHSEISLAGSSDPLQIGRDPKRKQYYFGGLVDEVHVSNVMLPAAWMATEFANQSKPVEFAKAGATESIVQQISMSLLTFDAEAQGASVELKWITLSEKNNESFTIERSADGITFTEVGVKPGAGNSNELLNYRFRDAKPQVGTNYYRVKLTNSDGEVEYSMITPVNVEDETAQEIKIKAAAPNPFEKEFEVSYSVPEDGATHIKLLSLSGEILHEEEITCVKESPQVFKYKADAPLKAGVYFLQVAQKDNSNQVKLIKRT